MREIWWRRVSVLVVVVLVVVGFQGVRADRAQAGGSEKRPFTAAWTTNGSYPWRGVPPSTGTQVALDYTWTADWVSGVFVGQSLAKVHNVVNPDGTGTLKGFQLFVGSLEGREGQIVFSTEATLTNPVDYQGTLVCLGGTGAFKGIRCEATYVGKRVAGGQVTEGWYSFDD